MRNRQAKKISGRIVFPQGLGKGPKKGSMKYKYKITEGDQTTEQEGMSLKRLIKGLDPKKTFIVEYINKKGNSQKKIITNGKHSDYNSSLFDSVG